MKKNIYLTKKSIQPILLINEEVKIYFIVYSSNKSVENLVYILNKLVFNNKIEKIKEINNTIFFSFSVPIKNYFILKKNLDFKIKEETLKFEFISIKFKNNNLSVDFFEKNYLNSINNEEFVEDLLYFNYLSFFTNKIFLIKLFLFIIYNTIKLFNNLKNIFLKKI